VAQRQKEMVHQFEKTGKGHPDKYVDSRHDNQEFGAQTVVGRAMQQFKKGVCGAGGVQTMRNHTDELCKRCKIFNDEIIPDTCTYCMRFYPDRFELKRKEQ
jgi:hypothetical protein